MTRLGARLVGLIGTLVITRFLSPEVMGEVGVAVVAVLTAQFASDFAFGQYIVVKSKDDPDAVFHAFFFNLLTTIVAAVFLLLLASPLGELLGAEEMERYLPVMVLSMILERLARIPESISLRELRFKLFSVASAMSEFAYVGVAISMAAAGYGGDSIVWANVAQYGLRLVWLGTAVERSLWFNPVRITWQHTRDMFRFGFPLAIGNVAHYCSTSWDRLVVTKLFGTSVHGVYALGKSLSSVPADNIGDAVADVLMPSFVRMTPEGARVAVTRACHLVAVVVYPMAAGLAAVSPTLVAALFNAEWAGIAMPLTILAAVSLIDPLGDTMASYLKARDMPWAVMFVQISFLGVLLAATFVLGSLYGLYGACYGVGVGLVYRALAALYAAHHYDEVSFWPMLVGLARVGMAAALMAGAVVGIRLVFTSSIDNVVVSLTIEIIAGGLAYIPAIFLCASPLAKEVLKWIQDRRHGRHEDANDSKDDSPLAT